MDVPPNFQVEVSDAQMTVTVRGPLRTADVIQLVRARYRAFRGARILWDLTVADVSGLGPDDFQRMALVVRENTPTEVERKTAYLVSRADAELAVWKYLYAVIVLRVPVEYRAFTDRNLAQAWLDAP